MTLLLLTLELCARRQEHPSVHGCGWGSGAARERSSALWLTLVYTRQFKNSFNKRVVEVSGFQRQRSRRRHGYQKRGTVVFRSELELIESPRPPVAARAPELSLKFITKV